MFSGTHNYSMDKKGRVSIPSEFREIMQKSGDQELVLTIRPTGDYHYLMAMPRNKWQPVAEDVEKDALDEEARNRRRLLMARMEICPLDRQGRILVPPRLRDYAGLSRELALVGTGINSFEIWDRQTFEKHFDELFTASGEKGTKSEDK
jgi:MraZ protein